MVPIADAHCDFLYAAGYHGADIAAHGKTAHHVTLESLRQGSVCLQYFAMWADLKHSDTPWVQLERYYRTYSEILHRHPEYLRPLDTEVLEAPLLPGKTYTVLTVEGAEGVEHDLHNLQTLRDWGVRTLGFTWNADNTLACAAMSGSREGLSRQAFEAMRMMDTLHMAVDVSHLNDAGFYDVLDHAQITPLASHSNARTVLDHARNLSDHQIRRMIARKGFIGINFYSPFIAKHRCNIAQIAEHICHILDLGGEDIVGFGSDFDGMEQLPWGVKGPQSFPKLIEELEQRGVRGELLECIAYKNLWRYTRELILQ